MKSIEAMARLTDIFENQNVENRIEEIQKCCSYMSRKELQSVISELIASVCVNCRANILMKVFEDAGIELDEKYDPFY